MAGDSVFLVGDFNAKLGRSIIPNDRYDMSDNGQYLYKMITDYNLAVLNALDTCNAVTSNDLVPFLKSMTIDGSKEITLWRKLKHEKCFTDHNAFFMKLEIPQYAQLKKVGSRETTWNFNDPLGWENFHKLTSRDMSLVWCWDDSYSADVSYDIWLKK